MYCIICKRCFVSQTDKVMNIFKLSLSERNLSRRSQQELFLIRRACSSCCCTIIAYYGNCRVVFFEELFLIKASCTVSDLRVQRREIKLQRAIIDGNLSWSNFFDELFEVIHSLSRELKFVILKGYTYTF